MYTVNLYLKLLISNIYFYNLIIFILTKHVNCFKISKKIILNIFLFRKNYKIIFFYFLNINKKNLIKCFVNIY